MPFIARNPKTNERIDILAVPAEFFATFQRDEITCQLCGSRMFPKRGHERSERWVRPHFVHMAHQCPTDYQFHPESKEHRDGKVYIATVWLKQFRRYSDATIEYEVPIPEVKRVVDVLVTFPNGHRIAHEVQLASITAKELKERTDDYQRAGIDTYWHLGKSAYNENNCTFLADYLCDFSTLRFTTKHFPT